MRLSLITTLGPNIAVSKKPVLLVTTLIISGGVCVEVFTGPNHASTTAEPLPPNKALGKHIKRRLLKPVMSKISLSNVTGALNKTWSKIIALKLFGSGGSGGGLLPPAGAIKKMAMKMLRIATTTEIALLWVMALSFHCDGGW